MRLGLIGDPNWLAVVLFARNLVANFSIFSDVQKSSIQQWVFNELKTQTSSDEKFKTVVDRIEGFIQDNSKLKDVEARLSREKTLATSLLGEIRSFISEANTCGERREQSLAFFGEKTIQAMESGEDVNSVVGKIREMLGDLMDEFKQETETWKSRAAALEHCANHDPLLPELHNRRALDLFMADSVARHHAEKKPLSVMMMDVDCFKTKINDVYGHSVGDDVLKALAKIVSAHAVQYGAFVARYGGDEMIVACENMTQAVASFKAEALRMDVENYEFQPRRDSKIIGPTLQFTISVGVAELQPDWTGDDLIEAADKAMYEVKECGRNLVLRYKPER
jgi:diguanylate cyclase (GGDEF)-like protein